MDNYKFSDIFSSEQLDIECNKFEQIIEDKYYFAKHTPAIFNNDTTSEFNGFVADLILNSDESFSEQFFEYCKIPKLKVGQRVSDATMERVRRILRGKATSDDLEFLESDKKATAKNLSVGLIQRIESLIINYICQIKNTSLGIGLESLPNTIQLLDNNSHKALLESIELASQTGKYNKFILSSKMANTLMVSEVSDKVSVIVYDTTCWTRNIDSLKEKKRFLPENYCILANFDGSIEFQCTNSTEDVVQLLLYGRPLTDKKVCAYYTSNVEMNPPDVTAWAAITGYPKIIKPENFKVFKLIV